MSKFMCVSGSHRDLHGLTHTFPTRRTSDLTSAVRACLILNIVRPFCVYGASRGFATTPSSPAPSNCSNQRSASAGSPVRSVEHTSELQSLMRISYAVLCLNKKLQKTLPNSNIITYKTYIYIHPQLQA